MPAPLIERAEDLAALEALVARAGEGTGGLVLVEADAGLGKSRLLAELRGPRTLSARASELEQGFAFGVVRTLLAGSVRALDPAGRDRLLAGPTAPAGVVLGLSGEAGQRAVQPSAALLDAIYWLVDGLCADGPLVLVVDDAQWADGPSLRALAYLANRADALPLALVCARRPGEEGADPRAAASLRHAAAEVRTLAPLSAGGVASLAAAASPTTLGPDGERALFVATRGNPFLVTQVIRELAAHGPEGLGPGRAISPGALQGVIGGRMAELPEAAQRVARAVGVLGDGAHLADVAGLTGLGAEAVLEAAGRLIGAGIFADGPGLVFAHPLLAEAIDAELSSADRALAHHRAAQLLMAREAEPERVAVHLGRSAPSADPAAVRVLRAAAQDALVRGVPEAAIVHLERALAEPPAAGERTAVTVELGIAELAANRDVDAAAHLGPALRDPAWPADVAASAAWARNAEHGYVGAVAALLEAAEVREAGDPDGALLLRGMAVTFNFFVPAPLRREVALPPKEILTGATVGERMALSAHFTVGISDGTTAEEAWPLGVRALVDGKIATDVSFPGALFATSPLMGLVYAERLEEAAQACALVEREARQRGVAGSVLAALFPRTLLMLVRGDVGATVAQAETALSVGAFLQGEARVNHDAFLSAVRLLALLAHEGTERADAELRAGGLDGELPPSQMWVVPARAQLHVAAGRAGPALADAQLWRQGVAFLGDPLSPIEFHTAEPLALQLAGRTAEAIEAGERELARARAWGAPARTAALLRTVAQLRPEAAAGLLEEAWALVEHEPFPLERARIRFARGVLHRRAGARTAARGEFEQAAQLAAECQAGPLSARAMDELRVLGARPRRAAFSGVSALTGSERRVAGLAAGGATNREIAQELFVTTKTIDSHLGRVYRKLGIAGRGELAAALAE